MSKPGPKNKSPLLAVVQGNPGRRPLPQNFENKLSGVGRHPNNMELRAKMRWRKIAREMPWLRKADREMLSLYCNSALLVERMEKSVLKFTDLIGEEKMATQGFSVSAKVLREARETCLKILMQFGASPSERTRIMADNPNNNAFSEHFGD